MHLLSRATAPQAGASPLQLGPKAEERGAARGNPLSFLLRLLLGSAAGFYFFLVGAAVLVARVGVAGGVAGGGGDVLLGVLHRRG
jgi:hypothetical protein